jgi:Cys-tRNA(Pro) deacylase
MRAMAGSEERVAAAASAAGLDIAIQRFPEGTRTAEDAAAAVGCDVAQIVKSLVFLADGRPVVALVSGANRLDPARLATALGANEVTRADGNAVRDATGYAIGGVPPFGHERPLPVLMDRSLLDHERLWAAAGRPDAVFEVTPGDLERVSGAIRADLAEAPADG